MRKLSIAFTLCLTLFLSVNLYPSGFQINEHGARALGMGGAFTAWAYGPSAVYFNPAGLAWLSGLRIQGGTSIIMPSSSFRGPYPSVTEYDMVSQTFFPSHFYATYQLDEDLGIGIGFNNPFGLGTDWEDDWVGRFVSDEIHLATYSLTAAVGYKINDMLSVGAGIQYNMATVTIKRFSGLQPFTGEAHFRFEGNDNGAIGFNAGILFKPLDNLSFGLSYRSEVEYNFEGTAEADGPSAIQSSLPAGDITSSLTTPQQIVFGAAYTVIPELTITADFQYVFWESYDTLAIDFTDPQYDDIANPRLYDNNFFVRLGAEYRYDEDWTFRGGVYYDKNPIKDEYLDATLPDADRFGFTLGAGYAVTEQMTVDAAYLFLRFNERTVDNSEINGSGNGGFVPFNGTYNNIANILSLTITYNF